MMSPYGPPAASHGGPPQHQQQHHHHHNNNSSSSNSHGGPSKKQKNSQEGFKIFIAGLPAHTEEADLMDCFGQLGGVLGCDLKKGYGFVVSCAFSFFLFSVTASSLFVGSLVLLLLCLGFLRDLFLL